MLDWQKLFEFDGLLPDKEQEIVQVGNQIWRIATGIGDPSDLTIWRLDLDSKNWILSKQSVIDDVNRLYGLSIFGFYTYVKDPLIYILTYYKEIGFHMLHEVDTRNMSSVYLREFSVSTEGVYVKNFAVFNEHLFLQSGKFVYMSIEDELTDDYFLIRPGETSENSDLVVFSKKSCLEMRFVELTGVLYAVVCSHTFNSRYVLKISETRIDIVSKVVTGEEDIRSCWTHENRIYLYTHSKLFGSRLQHFDPQTKKWDKIRIQYFYKMKCPTHLFFIDSTLYGIQQPRRGKSSVHSMNKLPSLISRSAQQISRNYKLRIENGETGKRMSEEVQNLEVPWDLKRALIESTSDLIYDTDKKMKRKRRREELKRNNNPDLVVHRKFVKLDEDVDDFCIGKSLSPDDPSLTMQYPLEIVHDRFKTFGGVLVGTKIWIFCGKENRHLPVQLFSFETTIAKWKREFYKNEGILNAAPEKCTDLMELFDIPSSYIKVCQSPHNTIIYAIGEKKLYEFDTVTRNFKSVPIDIKYEQCIGSFVFNELIYVLHLSEDHEDTYVSIISIDNKEQILKKFLARGTYGSKCHFSIVNGELYVTYDARLYRIQSDGRVLVQFAYHLSTDKQLDNVLMDVSNPSKVQNITSEYGRLFLNEYYINVKRWVTTEINGDEQDWYKEQCFPINDKIYIVWIKRTYKIQLGVQVLDMNPSISTRHILYLTKVLEKEWMQSTKEEMEESLNRRMRKVFNNIAKWKIQVAHGVYDSDEDDVANKEFYDIVDQDEEAD